MGILLIPLIILIYWIAAKVEKYQGEKAYQKYQEHLKELGLK